MTALFSIDLRKPKAKRDIFGISPSSLNANSRVTLEYSETSSFLNPGDRVMGKGNLGRWFRIGTRRLE